MLLNFDCIIIGSGIAGMTAALYLKRAGINTLIIEKEMAGGQINRCSVIENYPGCANIEGPVLAQNMLKQITDLNVTIKYAEVIGIIDEGNYKIVQLNNEQLTCKGVIIATGREPRKLGLTNEINLTGRGISWCAVCDGFFYRGKDVAVVGAGNSAIEEALYLSNICHNVKVIVRKDYLKAENYLKQQIEKKENVEIIYEAQVINIIGNNKLEAIDVKIQNSIKQLKIDGLFISIGYHPTCSFLKQMNLKLNDDYIEVDSDMRTNIKGIYACGDSIKKELYQLVTAAGEGALAANSYIKEFNNGQTIKNS